MAAKETISLKDLCKELRTDTRLARIRLRKSNLKKPKDHGWQWAAGSAELASARKVIKGETEAKAAPAKAAPKAPAKAPAKKSAPAPTKKAAPTAKSEPEPVA